LIFINVIDSTSRYVAGLAQPDENRRAAAMLVLRRRVIGAVGGTWRAVARSRRFTGRGSNYRNE